MSCGSIKALARPLSGGQLRQAGRHQASQTIIWPFLEPFLEFLPDCNFDCHLLSFTLIGSVTSRFSWEMFRARNIRWYNSSSELLDVFTSCASLNPSICWVWWDLVIARKMQLPAYQSSSSALWCLQILDKLCCIERKVRWVAIDFSWINDFSDLDDACTHNSNYIFNYTLDVMTNGSSSGM